MNNTLIKITFVLLLLNASCTKSVKVKWVNAERGTVQNSVTTINSGTVVAENQAVLSFGSPGRVAKIYTQLGEKVAKGKLLATLDNRELEATYENAKAEDVRAKELLSNGLISKSNFDETKRVYEVAKAALDKSVIIAPFDGLITELNLEVGETVTGQPGAKAPLRIVDLLPRTIKGDIDELDLPKIKKGMDARIRIPSVKNEFMAATVTNLVPFVSTTKEQERTVQIELKLKDKILPPVGASVDIEIITEKKDGVIFAPARSLLGKLKDRYVFLVREQKLKKVNVKTGLGNYERVEILEGLQESDIIALPSDTVELADGMKIELIN